MMRVALAFVLFAAHHQAPPAIPRDAQVREGAAGTALISGRVTDRETGAPLAGVTVTLAAPPRGPLGERPLVADTDADGRYAFTRLPAGPYSLSFGPPAHRATHLAQQYGETQPLRPRFRRPYQISLRNGEHLENADVALWRALAISGRVVDEGGEPLANVNVHAFNTDGSQATVSDMSRASDDRGAFRLFGLPPGEYLVCAEPRDPFPGTEVRERLVRTCHPSAIGDDGAGFVQVMAADVGQVEIRVRRSRTFSVTGTILTSSGAPLVEARPQVSVVRLDRHRTSSEHIEIQPGGQFLVRGLIPGDYLLRADKYGSGAGSPEREIARVPFRVDATDLEGLVAVMEKPASVRGRVVFEEPPALRQPGALRVGAHLDHSAARLLPGFVPGADVDSDLTFELSGLFGPQLITMSGLPRNYFVKSVKYGADEIIDTPTDFRRGDPRTLEILLSNRGAFVTGRVLDDEGRRAGDSVVVLFSADRRLWRTGRAIAVRLLVPPKGPYTVGPVRPGEYFIVAVSGEDREAYAGEPEMLETLARTAERVILVEHERRPLDLRIIGRARIGR